MNSAARRRLLCFIPATLVGSLLISGTMTPVLADGIHDSVKPECVPDCQQSVSESTAAAVDAVGYVSEESTVEQIALPSKTDR